MADVLLCLDVGGTEIKAALMDRRGRPRGALRRFSARSREGTEAILGNFQAIFRQMMPEDQPPDGICLAFPGPFDYLSGISRMRGLDKYDALYGVNLRDAFSRLSGVPGERVAFANDAAAFALGEMAFGETRGARRSLCVCIGTGCGSAFGVDGALAPEGYPGVPPEGYVYPIPFLEGCLDDYLSLRGIRALSREMLGEPLAGEALAGRANRGDSEALRCFLRFGERIRDGLAPVLRAFRPEVLCLGGQITRSAGLFLPPVEEGCQGLGIRVICTADTSLRAMQGLTRLL